MSNINKTLIMKSIKESFVLKERLLADDTCTMILTVAEVMVRNYRNGHKAIFFGNGGSAADAQHIAAELVGKYKRKRRGLPAIALTVNTSSLTSISNDYSFNYVFARQIEALGRPGDIAFGISTSGTSPNVIAGFKAARRRKLITVALTGTTGHYLRRIVDYAICVPSNDTPRVQEAHILIGHILCSAIERSLFG
jgi:D-sedoheptulose 7-phosphate isomerase